MVKKTPDVGYVECEYCSGTGKVSCGNCDGIGETTIECNFGYEHTVSCDECEDGEYDCNDCDGTGQTFDENMEVDTEL